VFETERSVQVVDTLAPEVSLIGEATKELLIGDLFNDPGASALDNVDGVVDVDVRGQVDTTNPGTYQIEYSASDNAGNRSAVLTRTVVVRIPTIEDLVSRSFTVITMDMNPTVAIFLDSTDRVIGVRALNEDANAIVEDYSYVNQNVEQVLEAIISRSQDYLNNNEVILIGVQSTSESKQSIIADRLERRITQLNVSLPQTIKPVIRTLDLNPSELRPVLRQEVPTQARQDYVQELIEVGRVPENANQIINRPIREIEAQRVESRVDEILNDLIPPQIRLQGNPNQNISLNGTYIEFGATVTDNLENDLEVTITGTVDTSRPGVYELVYTAKDSAGNEATPVTRRVTVGSVSSGGAPSTGGSSGGGSSVPTTPTTPTPTNPTTPTTPTTPANPSTPNDDVIINLNGAAEIILNVGNSFIDPGATAEDSNGKSYEINVSGLVNVLAPGKTYYLIYQAINDNGDVVSEKIRSVVVVGFAITNPLNVELEGGSNIVLRQGEIYQELGLKLSGSVDIPSDYEVQISGVINTNKLGVQHIYYNVTNPDGVVSRLVRTITIYPWQKPDFTGLIINKYDYKEGDRIVARINYTGPLEAFRQLTSLSVDFNSVNGTKITLKAINLTYNGSYVDILFDIPEGLIGNFIGGQTIKYNSNCHEINSQNFSNATPNCLAGSGTEYFSQWDEVEIRVEGNENLIEARSANVSDFIAKHNGMLLTNGSLFMWGNNQNGQLCSDDAKADRPYPININKAMEFQVSDKVTHITEGFLSYGLVLNNNRVYTWGYGHSYRLGNNSTLSVPCPEEITDYFSFEPDEKVAQFEMGTYTLLLTDKHRLFGWGPNNSSQDNADKTPILLNSKFNLSDQEKIVEIRANQSSYMVLTSAGRLFSWGYNFYGNAGNGSNDSFIPEPSEITVFFELESNESIIDFVSGSFGGKALTSNGRVFTWGRKEVVGFSSPNDLRKPVDITNRLPLGQNEIVERITENGVITNLNRVIVWGYETGDGTDVTRISPVEITSSIPPFQYSHITKTRGGIIVFNNGKVVVWGWNVSNIKSLRVNESIRILTPEILNYNYQP